MGLSSVAFSNSLAADASASEPLPLAANDNFLAVLSCGGGDEPFQNSTYNPADAADILKTRFVDKSNALGVNLTNGTIGYTAPAKIDVGNGGFPYELTAQFEWGISGQHTSDTHLHDCAATRLDHQLEQQSPDVRQQHGSDGQERCAGGCRHDRGVHGGAGHLQIHAQRTARRGGCADTSLVGAADDAECRHHDAGLDRSSSCLCHKAQPCPAAPHGSRRGRARRRRSR